LDFSFTFFRTEEIVVYFTLLTLFLTITREKISQEYFLFLLTPIPLKAMLYLLRFSSSPDYMGPSFLFYSVIATIAVVMWLLWSARLTRYFITLPLTTDSEKPDEIIVPSTIFKKNPESVKILVTPISPSHMDLERYFKRLISFYTTLRGEYELHYVIGKLFKPYELEFILKMLSNTDAVIQASRLCEEAERAWENGDIEMAFRKVYKSLQLYPLSGAFDLLLCMNLSLRRVQGIEKLFLFCEALSQIHRVRFIWKYFQNKKGIYFCETGRKVDAIRVFKQINRVMFTPFFCLADFPYRVYCLGEKEIVRKHFFSQFTLLTNFGIDYTPIYDESVQGGLLNSFAMRGEHLEKFIEMYEDISSMEDISWRTREVIMEHIKSLKEYSKMQVETAFKPTIHNICYSRHLTYPIR